MLLTGDAAGEAIPAAGEVAVEALGLAAASVAATVAAGKVVAAGSVAGALLPGAVQAASVPSNTAMTTNPPSDRRSLLTTPDDVSITSPRPLHPSALGQ